MRRLFGALVLVSALSCGGSSPSAPTPSTAGTPAPDPLPAAIVQVEGASLHFAAGVTAADRDLIAHAAVMARTFFLSRFGRTIAGTVTVNVGAGTGPMQAQGHIVTISAGEQSWASRSPVRRTSTVVHEFFHVLQGEGGWTFQPIQWLFEGAAEYVGYAAPIDAGMTTYATVRACEIEIYFNGGGPSTPPLHEISFALSSPVASRYAVGWLAIDHLVGGLEGTGRLKGMWENSGSMEQRFLASFGSTPLDYSSTFQNHRLTYQPGGGQACNSL